MRAYYIIIDIYFHVFCPVHVLCGGAGDSTVTSCETRPATVDRIQIG